MIPQDKPQLFRNFFPYSSLPKINFEENTVPMNIPKDIWITDTTFRDGQQAREPYRSEQMVHLYDLMHKLGGPRGVIRYTEFFLYTKEDRIAAQTCIDRGYEYPIVTSWIRANKNDMELVKKIDISESGILSSLSDYHIFYKFKSTREKTIENHLSIAEECLKREIIPRCHIEDATRADINNVVVPFVKRLLKLSDEYGIPTKVRICDTLGIGVPYPNACLPRSVPKMINAIISQGGLPSEWLEFHGHNDFHNAVAVSTAAWLYGCSGNNGTLLGIGERAGNTPIEGLLFQLLQLKNDVPVDTLVIKEIADYYKEIGYHIPEFYPLVGDNFSVTRAGVHADGMIKNPEIYTSYDFKKILGTAPRSVVGRYSGTSGIAWKVNELLGLEREQWISKDDPRIHVIYEYISNLYGKGRVTAMSDSEMRKLSYTHFPDLIENQPGPDIEKYPQMLKNLADD
jgi:isopropylmalate/homocitrate/citramalate synthase